MDKFWLNSPHNPNSTKRMVDIKGYKARQLYDATALNINSIKLKRKMLLANQTSGAFNFKGKKLFKNYTTDIAKALYLEDDYAIMIIEQDAIEHLHKRENKYLPFQAVGMTTGDGKADFYGTQTTVLIKGPEELKTALALELNHTKYNRWGMNLRKIHTYSKIQWRQMWVWLGIVAAF